MNFTSLLLHGLSAVSVFGDFIGVRRLLFTATLVVVAIFFLGVVVMMKFFADMVTPGRSLFDTGAIRLPAGQSRIELISNKTPSRTGDTRILNLLFERFSLTLKERLSDELAVSKIRYPALAAVEAPAGRAGSVRA